MSVFSFPRRLLICEITRESSFADADVSIEGRRHQEESCQNCQLGVEFTRFRMCSYFAERMSCSTNSQQSPTDSCSNAVKRRQYACHRASTSLLSLAYASRVKRCSFALRVQLFALATRAVIYAKELRARRKQYRGTSRGHTHSPYAHIRTPAPLVRGARQPHGMKFGQSSLETHQLYQPYRAQAPMAMAT